MASSAPNPIDDIDEPALWLRRALSACRGAWQRSGRRYDHRLEACCQLREAVEDVVVLAARRLVPLPGQRMRPLPEIAQSALACAFNRLDPADRYALAALRSLGPVRGARAEHLASALQRLLAAASLGSPAGGAGPAGDAGPTGGAGRFGGTGR